MVGRRYIYHSNDGNAELEVINMEGKTLELRVLMSNTKWLDEGDIKEVNKDLIKRMDSLEYVGKES